MGIYINGLDFHASAHEDKVEQPAASTIEARLNGIRALASEFRFLEKLGRAVPGLATMADSDAGFRNMVQLAGMLDQRAVAA